MQTALSMNDSLFIGRQIKVTEKRTNRPGISSTNRPPRIRGGRGRNVIVKYIYPIRGGMRGRPRYILLSAGFIFWSLMRLLDVLNVLNKFAFSDEVVRLHRISFFVDAFRRRCESTSFSKLRKFSQLLYVLLFGLRRPTYATDILSSGIVVSSNKKYQRIDLLLLFKIACVLFCSFIIIIIIWCVKKCQICLSKNVVFFFFIYC